MRRLVKPQFSVLVGLYALLLGPGALATRPDPVALHNQAVTARARALITGGHTLEARRLIEPLCFTRDTTAPMYCLLAETYIDDFSQNPSDSKKIEMILQAAIKADPSFSLAYKDMAEFCNVQGDYKKAVEYGNKSLACPEPYIWVYRQTAIAYSNLGQYDKALADINKFIALDSSKDATFTMKAGILEKMKRYDEAVAAYRQAFAKRPQDMTILNIVRCLEAQRKFPQAIDEISQLIKLNPHDPEAFAIRAKLQRENKNYAAALNDLGRAIDMDPTSRLYKARADVYNLLGQKQAAERDLASAKKVDSSEF
jgi:tetratricopeptide (TPR) repeat protein